MQGIGNAESDGHRRHFCRTSDPEMLARWYTDHSGIDIAEAVWQQWAGPTVFAPFRHDTNYFGRPEQQWMINFCVADLDAMMAQLKTAGIAVETKPEWDSEVGRFARIHDPEGNPIEPWQRSSRTYPVVVYKRMGNFDERTLPIGILVESRLSQNIYDKPDFFASYSQLPRSVYGPDGAPELPAIRALLPDLDGKRVVDLGFGFGFGWFSRWAKENGAVHVLGLDLSENMVERAKADTDDVDIEYALADLEQLNLPKASTNPRFDGNRGPSR